MVGLPTWADHLFSFAMKTQSMYAALGCLLLGACSQQPENQIVGTTDVVPDGAYVVLSTAKGVRLDSAQVKNQAFTFQNFPMACRHH